MADKKQFSNTKSIVKVETGIVTLISYRHLSPILIILGEKQVPGSHAIRYDNVTLIPLVLQLGLRIGPIQRMGAN
jgi:hypothetical protein